MGGPPATPAAGGDGQHETGPLHCAAHRVPDGRGVQAAAVAELDAAGGQRHRHVLAGPRRKGKAPPMDSPGHRDPRSGRTWPSDVPRWRGDAQQRPPPTELPGTAPVGVGRGERSLWRYRATLPPPGGTADGHGGGLHAAAAPRLGRRGGAAEVRAPRAHRQPRGPRRLGDALRAGDRRGDAGAEAERHRRVSDEAVVRLPDSVAAPRYGGGAR